MVEIEAGICVAEAKASEGRTDGLGVISRVPKRVGVLVDRIADHQRETLSSPIGQANLPYSERTPHADDTHCMIYSRNCGEIAIDVREWVKI